MSIATVVGGIGGVLLLVGLVGGGFEFSGALMPKVGRVSRILCFSIGGLLLVVAVGLGLAESAAPRDTVADPGPEPAGVSAAVPATRAVPPSTPAPATRPATTDDVFVARVIGTPGYDVNVFELPTSSSSVVATVPEGDVVSIVCTAQGEAVTSPLTGLTSSLWNGTTDGGFVPDVLVDTGTFQAVMPSCTG